MSFPGPLSTGDAELIGELREVLVAAGYDGPAVREALDTHGEMLLQPADLPLLLRRLEGREPLGTITALLVLGAPIDEAEAARAFAPLRVEQLEALGLVETGGGLVRAPVRLIPHEDVLIASDPTGEERPAEHVAGVHNASVTLAQLTVRRQVEAALDVATGCGIQAILAGRHSGRVVATDLNERALNYAAFNAVLAGADNVELRSGSYFEPAAGERFGLAVCNPPYVISPENDYLFRDSELPGDGVSEQVVRGLPGMLEEGAFASVVVSWAQANGEDWSARLRNWIEGSGCDALLLHYGTQDPLTHAGNWTRDIYGERPSEFDAALTRWIGYLERLGIDGVAYGGVVLRRRQAASNWVRAYDIPLSGARPAGPHIERVFENEDLLGSLADADALLGERISLAPRAVVKQEVLLRDREWTIDSMEISLDEGLGFRASIDPLIAHLLAALDGVRTLRQITHELADREGKERQSFGRQAVPVVRGMLELGFLQRSG
jgi:methylase of polypeptide subunit release factors